MYVTGAVVREGLYSMREGNRVANAIDMAGGYSGSADRSRVSGATLLRDGDHLHVRAQSEPIPSAVVSTPSVTGRINLNTATAQELETLPEIGPVTAKAIVDHRAKVGRFASVDQLLGVSGIGAKTLATIRPLVEVR